MLELIMLLLERKRGVCSKRGMLWGEQEDLYDKFYFISLVAMP